VADWGDGVSASCTVGPIVRYSAGSGWPRNALQHHWLMPISCHFRDCKALLVTSLTHVSGAITSVQTFTFTYAYLRYFYVTLEPGERLRLAICKLLEINIK